jgi:hypothetical protein
MKKGDSKLHGINYLIIKIWIFNFEEITRNFVKFNHDCSSSHNNMPFGQPTPSRPIGRLGVGHSQGVFGVFSYYQLVKLFSNIVPLIMEFTIYTYIQTW